MERVAAEGEASEECFGSIGLRVKPVSSQSATEGPPTKKKKKGEGQRGHLDICKPESSFVISKPLILRRR